MFGVVVANYDELKLREYRRYQAFYCGVCKSLKHRYGMISQVTLSYDMTFLGIVLSALYEDNTPTKKVHCLMHPASKHEAMSNAYTDYAAAMNVLLSYYKCKDDWEDEKKFSKKLLSGLLKKAFKKAAKNYPQQARIIEEYIAKQHEAEKHPELSADAVSAITGDMLGHIFIMQEDPWKESLYQMGFFLGKFIYIMDAYEDLNEDLKKQNYNPFAGCEQGEAFENMVREMLTMYAAESARAFERLPILEDGEMIRNILYSGIWTKHEKINLNRGAV